MHQHAPKDTFSAATQAHPPSLVPSLGAFAAGVGLSLLGTPGLAQTAPGLSAEASLPAVTVTETSNKPEAKTTYQATTTAIGKGKQALRDIPQSVTVVTEKLIADRNLDTVKDVLHQTAGITFQAAEGGEEDIRLRGFSLQTTGDIFLDGVRDPAIYDRDTFNLDRLELLRGSASMLFGRGSTGGAVNQVTKAPYLQNANEVNVTVGNHAYLRATGDFNIQTADDAALRIKAAHLGLEAVEHHPAGRRAATRDAGWTTVEADPDAVDTMYAAGAIDAADTTGGADLHENGFAVVRSGSQSALARKVDGELRLISHSAPEAWGLRSRSKEQRFALELLLDPDVSVVALDGRAGTGKTLLAIAAGLEQVVEQRRYERLAVYRPLVPVGRADVGFLPGGLDEKLDPWMSAIHDAIVALTDQRSSNDAKRMIDDLQHRNQLSLESVTFLRGRSLHRQFVVVDEAQNLEPTTLKTILTRIGEGTKVVFTGDTSQIDAPYMGESNNALAVLIQAFSNQPCFGHVTLAACERSEVASLAAELL